MSGTAVQANPTTLAADGDDLLTIANAVYDAVSACASELSGYSGMAGDDPVGEAFAEQYDDDAPKVLEGMVNLAGAIAALEPMIQGTASRYRSAEMVGALLTGSTGITISEPATFSKPSIPSVLGPQPETPLGQFADILQGGFEAAGIVIPTGDTGQVRSAATAWTGLGSDLESCRTKMSSAFGALDGMDIPQRGDILAIRDHLATSIGDLSHNADAMGEACTKFADNMDQMREELAWMLGQIVAEILITMALGAALSFLTAGAAAAAAAAKIALTIAKWMPKIAQLISKLRILIQANRLFMRSILRALGEGVQEAASAVAVQGAVNFLRRNDANFTPPSLTTTGLSTLVGSTVSGPVGNRVAGVNPTFTRNVAAGATEGAVDGMASAGVESMANGTPFSPLSAVILGSVLGGGMRPAMSGRSTTPSGAGGLPGTPGGPGSGAPTLPIGTNGGGDASGGNTGGSSSSGSGSSGPSAAGASGGSSGVSDSGQIPGASSGGSGSSGSGGPGAPRTDGSDIPQPGSNDGSSSRDVGNGVDIPADGGPSVPATLSDGGSGTPGAPSISAPEVTSPEVSPASTGASDMSGAKSASAASPSAIPDAPSVLGDGATPSAEGPSVLGASGSPDVGVTGNGGAPEAGPSNGGFDGSAAPEGNAPDTSTPEPDVPVGQDAPPTPAAPGEAGSPDAGSPDAGSPDAGSPDDAPPADESPADDAPAPGPLRDLTSPPADGSLPAVHAGSADGPTLEAAIRAEYPGLAEVNGPRFEAGVAGHDANCTRCAVATDLTMGGSPAFAMPTNGPQGIAEIEAHAGRSFEQMGSWDAITERMNDLGPGSRGIVGIGRGPGRVGHMINVIADRNGVVYLDGQVGRPARLEVGQHISLIFVETDSPSMAGDASAHAAGANGMPTSAVGAVDARSPIDVGSSQPAADGSTVRGEVLRDQVLPDDGPDGPALEPSVVDEAPADESSFGNDGSVPEDSSSEPDASREGDPEAESRADPDRVVWEGEGQSLTASQYDLAMGYLDGSSAAEPEFTAMVRGIESTVPGARLEGLEYRLKDHDSFLRKFAQELEEDPDSDPASILVGIKDSVRYTFVADSDSYAGTMGDVMAALRERGLTPYGNLKNNWGPEGSGYQGINSNWVDSSGRIIEVQLHTPESLSAKQETHDVYERRRISTSPEERTRLQAEQDRIFDAVPRPTGADSVDWPA